jgi:hypothetical protein
VVSSLFDAGYVDTSVAERRQQYRGLWTARCVIFCSSAQRTCRIGPISWVLKAILIFSGDGNLRGSGAPAFGAWTIFFWSDSQALALGSWVIASRTHNLQLNHYHQNMIEFFDGNHLELAGRIRARPQFARRDHFPEFNVETNTNTSRPNRECWANVLPIGAWLA